MNERIVSRRTAGSAPLALVAMLAVGALGASQASAQVPARFYWKSLSGGNAVPLINMK